MIWWVLFLAPYDPLALARSTHGKVSNPEAGVPAMCYTKTGGASNPCWTCHTAPVGMNQRTDFRLQAEYAFSDFALTNHWKNLFVDRRASLKRISDEETLKWIRTDNYSPLRDAMATRSDFQGYRPDLDFRQGFGEDGFARDGSGWRAFRYKPFPGTFWPTNGSTDDAFIRLPSRLRKDHARNLEVLEGALSGTGGRYSDGTPAKPFQYPLGTELLHSVRYIDPDAPSMIATRMKELRYMAKFQDLDDWAIVRAYEREADDKQEGKPPGYAGDALLMMRNSLGWAFRGFIEDEAGRLRLQTDEEHRFCMGCHSGLGVTIDSTFSFPRKVPGPEGWRYQDLRGMKDVPQDGHGEPEILTYFRRVGGGDELRANTEVLRRFFKNGAVDEVAVRRAAPGGDRDISYLIAPSRKRALELDKAYMTLVREQRFTDGRDAVMAPAVNVHRSIKNGSTELDAAGNLHHDGRLRLKW